MATVYLAFSKPTMMPHGGMSANGETVGFDSVNDAAFIASAVASGAAAVGSAPTQPSYDLPAAVTLTRVKMSVSMVAGTPIYSTPSAGAQPVFVGACPATLDAGEIMGFPAAMAAAMIANGQAVSN